MFEPHWPPEIERAAAVVEANPHYRVLRAIPPPKLFPLAEPVGKIRSAVLLDTETTGLDPATDSIIELAALKIWFDARGKIVRLGRMRDWLEDPGRPLAPEIVRLTGLTDADLAGQRIDEQDAIDLIGSADLLVGHNSKFDSKFVERRFPALAGKAWACSMADVDWPGAGYDGRKLGHLLMQASGMFHAGHRADADVWALLWLLATEMPGGVSAFREMIDTASTPTIRVEATRAPFEAKDRLKARRYRWNPVRKVWWTEINADAVDAERLWLERDCCCPDPTIAEITWFERHR